MRRNTKRHKKERQFSFYVFFILLKFNYSPSIALQGITIGTHLASQNTALSSRGKLMPLGLLYRIVDDPDSNWRNLIVNFGLIWISTMRSYRRSRFWYNFDLFLIKVDHFWLKDRHKSIKRSKESIKRSKLPIKRLKKSIYIKKIIFMSKKSIEFDSFSISFNKKRLFRYNPYKIESILSRRFNKIRKIRIENVNYMTIQIRFQTKSGSNQLDRMSLSRGGGAI